MLCKKKKFKILVFEANCKNIDRKNKVNGYSLIQDSDNKKQQEQVVNKNRQH